ncbi:AAA family ATPase [Vibrio panuliri]|uniref:AAA family ATPase n=1 Tax=Vibrio panuliri TaxID=1381081 RepID=A0ABX3FDR0_9VIBR|nr:AAA family ATPase [Vibrio panuliri]KAB1454374.1 ATP-binding protein [Vibrio panuliri]OLQ87804.1 AAA family ATPase [Vibrio panuliri]
MRHLLRDFYLAVSILFCLLLTSPSFASNEYGFQTQPQSSPEAIKIAKQVSGLPEPLFMTAADKRQVNLLLARVLRIQREQIAQFASHLDAYRNTNKDSEWNQVQSSYFTLTSLNQSKQVLLDLTNAQNRDRLTGFGPYGVTQFKQEWRLTQLNVEYLLYFQLRSFKALVADIFISPIPVLWAASKVLFIYFGLVWWLANSKRLIDLFRQSQLESKSNPPLWVRLIWYISRAHRAIAWLIAITLSLRVLSQIPSLQHLSLLEIFTWWVLGGSIAISFILEFAYRNSHTSSREVIALRLSTIRRYVWSIIIAGVIMQISIRTLGKGTIYSWIYSALFFWFVLVTVSVLRLWREKVFEALEHHSERPVWVNWAVNRQKTFLLNIPATAVGIVWLTLDSAKHRLMSVLSRSTLFSQALAYLFRIEVAKQSDINKGQHNLVRIKGEQVFDYVLPGNIDSTLIDYASDEAKQLSRYLMSDNPAICVVSGERGIGATTLLNSLLNKVSNAEPIYLNCPYAGYSELLSLLALSLGLDEDASEIQILAHLRKSDTAYLIAIDNAHRLVKPMVGGLNDLMRITNLLRRSKKNHRIVFSIVKSSWRFVDRARGERLLFDLVCFLPRWSEKQIAQLLDSRINQELDKPLSFEGLVVPKQWDQDEMSEEERAKQGFYRILWHYSDGNPTVALRFFRLSIHRNKETEQAVVRLFHVPESQELENMPKPMLAVLRSIIQLEIASPEILTDCTQLSLAEITGILRYFQSRGYIEWSEDQARISDHWFRHITNVLDRQHLLVK